MTRFFVRFLSLLFLLAGLRCFALEKQPVAEYHSRRVALSLKLKGPALIFGADEPGEEYLSWRQDEDFYYLTGWDEPGAALLIQSAVEAHDQVPARPYREVMLLPIRNLRMERYTGVKLDAATADALAHDTNDTLAAAVAAHPDRFSAFATLALQTPEKAAVELERCINQLEFKGLIVMGSLNGVFLDDPRFTPVFEAVHALDVPLYVHPGLPPKPVADVYFSGLPGNLGFFLSMAGWGWHAETGLHCLRLMLSGVLDRFPKLKIIVGHMGDHLPFNIARADRVFREMAGEGRAPFFKRGMIEYFRENFYITTSGYFDMPPFVCARDVIGTDHVLFSVDYPYASNAEGRKFLDALPVSREDFEKIAHGNAERILKLTRG
jgi:hypothetical protein